MNAALPLMPLLHAGATGAEQDRWDLFGLALITLSFLLVTWVMLDVLGGANARERPIDARRPATRSGFGGTDHAGVPIAEQTLASHATTDQQAHSPRRFGVKAADRETT